MRNTRAGIFLGSSIAFAGMCVAWPVSAAGWKHLGAVESVTPVERGVELATVAARVRIEAVDEAILRVRLAPGGEFSPDHSWAVLPEARREVTVEIQETPDEVVVTTAALRARIRKSPLLIAFQDADGELLAEDHPDRPMAWSDSGVRVWKSMPAGEHYYGLGEKAGPLDRRGQAFVMWNTDAYGYQESSDPLYKSIPFFLTLMDGLSYGIFFDNTHRGFFDFGKESPDTYTFGASGGEIDYYFLLGPHPKDVLARYTALTGRTPLPPRWALGYQQCRYSYYPEARVREVAETLREKKIPTDVIYLDIDYQDGNRPFTIDRERFPDFEGMVRDLTARDFKVVAITDLHLKQEEGYPPYDSGLAADAFVRNPDGTLYVGEVWPGASVFPDFTLSRVREWWGTLYADFVALGLHGFWNDMNEPAIFQRDDGTMPLGTVHRLDDGSATDHREIHNVFGMQNVRATYEGLRRLRPDQRPFVLTRAAYAGTQRWAATWTGDNSSTWNHYRMTVPMLLGLGLSGYALAGNDVGGFVGSPPPEVLTRWSQLGVFTPIFRNHTESGSRDQEPWVHGLEEETIRRRWIELRYALMPYIYTSVEEMARTGVPLMRPLFLEYPEDRLHYGNAAQFLFGRDLLIAPDLSETVGSYGVTLPEGPWYDYHTGLRVEGKRIEKREPWMSDWYVERDPAKLSFEPGPDELPVLVRGGAILPHQTPVQSTAEVPEGPLVLRVYPPIPPRSPQGDEPGEDCSGSLYWDDGESFAYTRGELLRVAYSCASTDTGLEVAASARQGSFAPWWERIRLEIHGVEDAPRAVRLNEQTVDGWSFFPERRQVVVTVPETAGGWRVEIDLGEDTIAAHPDTGTGRNGLSRHR